jgi:acyl carrier protein phosphodiesterase
MNHLAHCFLSFHDAGLLVGNFIGDDIKGKDWQHYPRAIQRSILLHRAIDSFTDNHPLTDRSVDRIRPLTRRYASPFVDILYDHLLTLAWVQHSEETFGDFANKTYTLLTAHADVMPNMWQERLPRMVAGQFLHGYTHREGLEWVLERFSTRLAGEYDPKAISAFFFEHLADFQSDFDGFFPDLLAHCHATIEGLDGVEGS